MIRTEQQLRKIIKETLILNETGIELDDVIAGFQKDFKIQNSAGEKEKAITIIRKNNLLLEIILYLVDNKVAADFKDFYKNSGFNINDSTFMDGQETKRKNDLNSIKVKVKKFLDQLSTLKNNDDFLGALDVLKKDLSNYIPEWYVLQYLFYNINKDKFKVILENLATTEKYFYPDDASNPVKKYFINNAYFFGVLGGEIIPKVVQNINKSKLEEREKTEILSDTARSREFAEGIEEGDWTWLTDIVDDTVNFFFPNLRSITTEIKKFYSLAEKAAGGKEEMQKKLDELMQNTSIKKVLEGIGLGKIPKEDELQKALDVITAVKNQF
jgi:hypothetical protein